jgi:hypothetical protein
MKQLGNKIWKSQNPSYEQVLNRLRTQAQDYFWGQVEWPVRDQVWRQVWTPVWIQVREQSWGPSKVQLEVFGDESGR